MTADALYENGCQGKVAYRTAEEADRFRVAMQAAQGKQLDIYQCEFCKKFHTATRRRFRKWERHHAA